MASVPSAPIRRPSSGAAAPEVAQHRRALVGEVLEVRHQRPQLAQEGGQPVDAAAMSSRRSADASPVALACTIQSATRPARAPAGRAPGRSRAPGGPAPGSARRGSPSTWSVSRSAGLARWINLVQLLAPAGQAGAELAQQDREAFAVGQAHDVDDEVEVHRRAGAAPPAAAARPCRRPLDPLELRRRARARLALDELLADQRLRADRAVASVLKGVKSSSSIRSVTAAFSSPSPRAPRPRRPARPRPSRPRPRPWRRCRTSRARSSGPPCRRPVDSRTMPITIQGTIATNRPR